MDKFKKKVIIISLTACLVLWISIVMANHLPEFYGLYISQNGKLITLGQGNLTFKTGLSIGGINSGMYGITDPPIIRLDSGSIEIIYFNQEAAPSKVYLSKLEYMDSAPARIFDVKKEKTDPRFFSNVYGVSYYSQVDINQWVVDYNIPLNVAPITEKPGMYRLVPDQELPVGIYALNLGNVGGPRYYTGTYQFYPFAVGTVEWYEGLKEQNIKREPSLSDIPIFPGCVPKKPAGNL